MNTQYTFDDLYKRLSILINKGKISEEEIVNCLNPSYDLALSTTARLIKAGKLTKNDVINIFNSNLNETSKKRK